MAGLLVDVLHTPGHTADSVCFVVDDGDQRAVLTGDTVLGRGSTVVAHPDGTLAAYLTSLRRIVDLGPVTLLPGHGPVRPDAAALARDYLAHREQRLEQVREAVAAGAASAPEVVRRVYADVDESLWPAAELSVLAQLDYLADHPVLLTQPPLRGDHAAVVGRRKAADQRHSQLGADHAGVVVQRGRRPGSPWGIHARDLDAVRRSRPTTAA